MLISRKKNYFCKNNYFFSPYRWDASSTFGGWCFSFGSLGSLDRVESSRFVYFFTEFVYIFCLLLLSLFTIFVYFQVLLWSWTFALTIKFSSQLYGPSWFLNYWSWDKDQRSSREPCWQWIESLHFGIFRNSIKPGKWSYLNHFVGWRAIRHPRLWLMSVKSVWNSYNVVPLLPKLEFPSYTKTVSRLANKHC